jgi:folate-binding protein YgfZ
MTAKQFALAEPARGVLKLTGEDRGTFLQGLVSNDVRQIAPDRAICAALLTAQGKYLHDFFIAALGDAWLIEGEGARIADLRRRLGLYKLRAKIAIEDVSADWEVAFGWGEEAAASFGLDGAGRAKPAGGGIVFADPRLAELGIRLIAPRGMARSILAEAGLTQGDLAGWDRLRLGLGVPDGSRDLELEKAILLESGFDELNGVAWDKGCYIGQELTARTKYRGLVKKRLMPVELDGAVPAPGTLVMRGQTEAGEIRSGQEGIALALIRLDALAAGPLKAGETEVRPRPPAWLALPDSAA